MDKLSSVRGAMQFIALLPALFQFAEDIHGPKTGSTKFGSVVGLAQAVAITMANAGIISEGAAHDTLTITETVQDTFDKVKNTIFKPKAPILEMQNVKPPSMEESLRRAMASSARLTEVINNPISKGGEASKT